MNRYRITEDPVAMGEDMTLDPKGGWVKYEDYSKLLLEHQQLSNEYLAKSYAMEMQKNETAAYMRDYEREKSKADKLREDLSGLYTRPDELY